MAKVASLKSQDGTDGPDADDVQTDMTIVTMHIDDLTAASRPTDPAAARKEGRWIDRIYNSNLRLRSTGRGRGRSVGQGQPRQFLELG